MTMNTKIRAAIRKNYPEFRALVSGKLPDFVYGKELNTNTIPVFVFHEIDRDSFEEKLIYLKKNGYTTLDADELLDCTKKFQKAPRKSIVLTFDDGHISLWKHAFPLLKKYNFKAVSFICPGLVPEPEKDEMKRKRKLCNWEEIKNMHDSGCIDFQSHGMHHNLVFISSGLVDFLSPSFTSHYFGKKDRTVVLCNQGRTSITNLWPYEDELPKDFLGMPMFKLTPRLATDKRFHVSEMLRDNMCNFVRENGKESFFERKDWRKTLNERYLTFQDAERGRSISGEEYQGEVAEELKCAKEIIEKKLPGKKVRHFCFPWYEVSRKSLSTAEKCGYNSAFLGVDAYLITKIQLPSDIKIIQRISEKYIFLLPGKGKKNFFEILS